MPDPMALTLLIMWLAAVVVLAIGCALLIVSGLLADRPAGQLKIREVLVPLWCALAGPGETQALQEILAGRLARQRAGDTTIRDVARHRAGKQLHEPRHKRPGRTWLDELDDDFLLDRGNPLYWTMMTGRWPPYL